MAAAAVVLLLGSGSFGGPAALPVVTQSTTPSCRYEENCDCRVPGMTVRWKAAACMAREQTDDFEHDGVQACLARPDPDALRTLGACAKNAYWKRQTCLATREARDVEPCVRDAAFIPRIVERGAGGLTCG